MLKKPRRVILLVKAGQAVDDFIEKLVRPRLLPTAASGATRLFLERDFTYFYLGDFFSPSSICGYELLGSNKQCLDVSCWLAWP